MPPSGGKKLQSFSRHLKDAIRTFARTFGLGIVIHSLGSLRHLTGRGLHEPLKVAIRQSRSVSLMRSLIHAVPIGFALYEIILNWNEWYVGVDTYNQAFYQFLAKIHEIIIQASLGTIIFSFVRHELAIGEGLPFGALFSGLQLNQISYLWSMEYWGAVRSHHLSFWRKVRLFGVITLCIALGTLSGPSSAILLVPRLQFWPAGSTHIWLNATREQLWPSRVDESLLLACNSAQDESVSNECPWSEWSSILDILAASQGSVPPPYDTRYGFKAIPGHMQLSGKSAMRQFTIALQGDYIDQGIYPALSTTQSAAVADALVTASSFWILALRNVTARRGHGNALSDQSDSTHTIKHDYYQPYVSSWCVPDIIDGPMDNRPLALPLLFGANNESQSDTTIEYHNKSYPAILRPGLERSKLIETPDIVTHYRLKWIDVWGDRFQGSSIGAVILGPKSTDNQSQPFMACNLAAGWGSSILSNDAGESALTGIVSSIENLAGVKGPGENLNIPIKSSGAISKESSPIAIFEYPYFPQIPINITRGWADLLNPPLNNSNSTIINQILQDKALQGEPEFDPLDQAPLVLSGLVANGLARIGFSSEIQGDLKTTERGGVTELDGNYWLSGKGDVFRLNGSEGLNWTKLHMESTLEGHAYNTIGTPPKVAITILTIYSAFALCHIIYAGISGISSTSWDSIAEVTALAMNSTPTACLRNTCAGISELHIFKLPVRILATKDDEGEGEHLELVFGNVPEEKTKQNLIEPNRAYGTMPVGKHKRS